MKTLAELKAEYANILHIMALEANSMHPDIDYLRELHARAVDIKDQIEQKNKVYEKQSR